MSKPTFCNLTVNGSPGKLKMCAAREDFGPINAPITAFTNTATFDLEARKGNEI
jgi:hypothetical protein